MRKGAADGIGDADIMEIARNISEKFDLGKG